MIFQISLGVMSDPKYLFSQKPFNLKINHSIRFFIMWNPNFCKNYSFLDCLVVIPVHSMLRDHFWEWSTCGDRNPNGFGHMQDMKGFTSCLIISLASKKFIPNSPIFSGDRHTWWCIEFNPGFMLKDHTLVGSPYKVLEIKSGSVRCNANTLLTIISLWPLKIHY